MKILIVDDMAIVRDPIAAVLNAAGYQTVCAGSGKEALLALKAARPDLVLLDIHLPDIDGLQILRAIRATPANAKLPVILLSAEDAKESIVTAGKLGVHGYFLKSKFSLKDLLARVQQTVASGGDEHKNKVAGAGEPVTTSNEIPQLLSREQFLTRTKTAMKARTLSGVVTQVISLATSPRTELADLAQVVSRDTVLATRVLQAANSAAYRSAKGTVSTISDAIRQVGCSTIRNIAAAVGIFQAMPETSADGFNPIRCWQHSFAVAQLCESLASAGSNSGAAYLVGLCHDLGEIVLRTQFGTEYRQIMEIEKRTGRNREDLELLMLGMTHGELVNTILQCFGLPDAVRAPIEWFHANTKNSSLGSPRTMEGILRVAEWYANGVLLASSESAQLSLLTTAQCHCAVGAQNPPRPDTEKLRGEIMALTGMLARLSPSEEAELMKPLLSETDRKLWIVRDPSVSSLDPVSAALSSLARAKFKERLPGAEEIAEIDGLVILGGDSLQQTASAMEAGSLRAVPILRVVSECAAGQSPTLLLCPVTLTQLKNFCDGLTVLKKAA